MDGIVSDEGRKRRLPVWMTGEAAADQIMKSENEYGNGGDKEKPTVSKCREPKSKARIARRDKEASVPDGEALDLDEPSLLENCGRKGRKRKSSHNPITDCDGVVHETGFEKEVCGEVGRRNLRSATQKRRKGRSAGVESSEETENRSLSEDELTMEDLMCIAKEYIEDDKDRGQEQSMGTEIEEESLLPAIGLSRDESRGSVNTSQSRWKSSAHEETASLHKSIENCTSEGITTNSTRSGDPTQDMLTLFLGPLLKNPQGEEKMVESITKDMALTYEFQKQDPIVNLGEELVPLTKKKSSLKDKVAMFLD